MTTDSEEREESDSDQDGCSAPEGTRKVTAVYLEKLQRTVMAEFMKKNFRKSPILRKHISEHYTMANSSVCDCPIPLGVGREEVFDNVETICREEPGVGIEIHGVTAVVRRGNTRAVVYFNIREKIIACGEPFWRQGFAACNWRRRPEDGEWEMIW